MLALLNFDYIDFSIALGLLIVLVLTWIIPQYRITIKHVIFWLGYSVLCGVIIASFKGSYKWVLLFQVIPLYRLSTLYKRR